MSLLSPKTALRISTATSECKNLVNSPTCNWQFPGLHLPWACLSDQNSLSSSGLSSRILLPSWQPSVQPSFYLRVFYWYHFMLYRVVAQKHWLQTAANNKMAIIFSSYKPIQYLLPLCFVLLLDTPFGTEMQISDSFDLMNTNVVFINLPNDSCTGAHPAFR